MMVETTSRCTRACEFSFQRLLGLAVLLGTISVFAVHAKAQDTRNVTEPAIPPSCAVLTARLTAPRDQTLADEDEGKSDGPRLQQALDHCQPGQAVELKTDGTANAFLSGPLQLRAGVTLVIDNGAILFGSRNPADYQVSPGSCGKVDNNGKGCRPLISADHVSNAAVMGDGVIDVSWWDLAQEAKVKNLYQNCPRVMVLSYADNFTLYRITLRNSPNFHVLYRGGNGFTAWGVTIDSPKSARNTDGIDPANATNVTITHCYIHAGDDNVAIKANASGPSSHMTISHNHFYTGHGMSIGSETDGGVSAIRVTDLSIDGADNGLRIKSNSSKGGLVRDVVYEDVCIRDTKNPVLMDSNYSFYGKERNKLPTFTDIVLRDVRVMGQGKVSLDGYDGAHRLGITFDNVFFDAPVAAKMVASHADITLVHGVNFLPSGQDVRVSGKNGHHANSNGCDAKFVAMPARAATKPAKRSFGTN
jgi:polygalacturonase